MTDERIKIGDTVQHCRRPDFELINHPFAPSECEECARIEEIQNGALVVVVQSFVVRTSDQ